MRYNHPELGHGRWERFEEALSSAAKTEDLFTLEELEKMTKEQKLNVLFISPTRATFIGDGGSVSESTDIRTNFRPADLRGYRSLDGVINQHNISKDEIINLIHQERLNLSLLAESETVIISWGKETKYFPHLGIFSNRRDIPIKRIIALSSKQYENLKILDSETTVIATFETDRESALANNQFIFDDLINFSATQIKLIGAFSAQQIVQLGNRPLGLANHQLHSLKNEKILRLMREGYISIDDFLAFSVDTINMYEIIMTGDHLLASYRSSEKDANNQNKLTLFQLTHQYLKLGEYQYQDFVYCSHYLASKDSVDSNKTPCITMDKLLNLSKNEYHILRVLIRLEAFKKKFITFNSAFWLATNEEIFLKIVKLDSGINLTRYNISHLFEFRYLINVTDELIDFFKNSRRVWKVQRDRNQIQITLKKIHSVCLQYSPFVSKLTLVLYIEILSYLTPVAIMKLSLPYLSLMEKKYGAKQSRFFLSTPIEEFELDPDNVEAPASEKQNAI